MTPAGVELDEGSIRETKWGKGGLRKPMAWSKERDRSGRGERFYHRHLRHPHSNMFTLVRGLTICIVLHAPDDGFLIRRDGIGEIYPGSTYGATLPVPVLPLRPVMRFSL